MPTNPASLAALRAGDPDAIERFYGEHAATVLGWVIRLGGPRLDTEDVAQEVFIVAIRRLGSFRGDAALTTWLFAITRRVVANARRRAALRTFIGLSDVAEPRTPTEGADLQLERLRRRRAIQHALERLRRPQREVIVLMDLEERTAPEVSALLGIPVGTVYSRLHHARRAFATALRREGLGTEDDHNVLPLRSHQ